MEELIRRMIRSSAQVNVGWGNPNSNVERLQSRLVATKQHVRYLMQTKT